MSANKEMHFSSSRTSLRFGSLLFLMTVMLMVAMCDASSGEVIELDLSCSCLHGRFHSNTFQNIPFLSSLDLSYNDLYGQIPSSIGKLSNLTSVNLSCNHLFGQITSSIGTLSNLTSLRLSSNRFSGQIPSSIGNLTYLTSLSLFNNQFSGQIPSSITKLSRLEYLNLGYNNFDGEIPSSLGSLKHWRYAFWGEAVLMAPFAVLGFLMKPLQLKVGGNEIAVSIETYKSSYKNAVSKSCTQFGKDMIVLCKEKVFVVNVLGYVSYNFVIGAYSYWGPKAGYNIYKMKNADIICGIIGTLSGGLILDRVTATIPNAFKLLSGATFLGAIFCFTAFTLKSLYGFIALFALGELLVFATQAPVNYVCLHCVEPSLRPLSMAISTVAIHIFGDVPSSPLVGIVQDHINSWRKTALILTSVLFLAAAIWFIGIFINSVDRFNGEESESEKQRRQEQSIVTP
ncbi:unnamed protein product [Thlaspi arvense]|uniref:Disease resistance R13L4/SHOC-2-like LRR domain-containing protein n=1 Tax=Thlaspi arvense TaxID=13288 RepID=A0AAU9SAQ1_THLAR|nr:unnamed protein product [Thlaspi arvense]